MNSTQHLIQQYYDYFNKKDMSQFLILLHDDIIHNINQGGTEIGKKQFTAFMERMNRCYQETIRNLIVMTSSDGKHAACEFIVDGIYMATDSGLPPASQQHYSLLCGAFFEIKDNKIFRVTNYYNLNDWLRQISNHP